MIASITVAISSYALILAHGTRLFLPSRGASMLITMAISITMIAAKTTIGNQNVYGEDSMLVREQADANMNPEKLPKIFISFSPHYLLPFSTLPNMPLPFTEFDPRSLPNIATAS